MKKIEDIGGTVIPEEVRISLAQEYFADNQKSENLELKEIVDKLTALMKDSIYV